MFKKQKSLSYNFQVEVLKNNFFGTNLEKIAEKAFKFTNSRNEKSKNYSESNWIGEFDS
jgi:hypothetical protein